MEPRVERCTSDDAPVLTEVAHASKRHWGYPERYIAAWREALTVAPELAARHEVWACRVGDTIAGFYVLVRCAGRMELEHFWVRPEFMGRGIGRRLFEHALATTRSAGVGWLEITADPNAEGFYLRLGARCVGAVFAPVEGEARFLPRLTLEVPPST